MPRAILICLPNCDFDPTEVATPWHRLREAGFRVAFATENAQAGQADPLLLTGVLFGQLGAEPDALERFDRLRQSPEFCQPLAFSDVRADSFSGVILPGGHAKGMRQYLESEALRRVVLAFWQADKLVAAICHGVVVLARTIDNRTGRSVLADRQCTALTKSLEFSGLAATAWRLGDYYRTYPEWVQAEVTRNLVSPKQFLTGRAPWVPFAVRDGNLITARWPRDAELFAAEIVHCLAQLEVKK